MEQRYLEKVGHWENAQEALDQLADELLASRTLLRESQQRADHLKGLVETMREQVDTIKQQVGTNTPAYTTYGYDNVATYPSCKYSHVNQSFRFICSLRRQRCRTGRFVVAAFR